MSRLVTRALRASRRPGTHDQRKQEWEHAAQRFHVHMSRKNAGSHCAMTTTRTVHDQ
jgi:hypothetical protein